jgi:hypothetical protein
VSFWFCFWKKVETHTGYFQLSDNIAPLMAVRRLSSGDPMDIRMFIPQSPYQHQGQQRAIMVRSPVVQQQQQRSYFHPQNNSSKKNEEDPQLRMARLKSLQAKKDLVISKRKQSLSGVSLVQFKSRRKNFAPQSGWARSRYIPQNV